MSKSETGLRKAWVRVDGNGHEMVRVGQGRAYGVLKMESRFEVRMENRKWIRGKGLGNKHGSRGSRDQSSHTVLHGV